MLTSDNRSSTAAGDHLAFGRAQAMMQAGEVQEAAEAFRKISRLKTFLAQEAPNGRCVVGPDFLIIGAPRGGTSWLKRLLRHHPEVSLPTGEPHYFWRGLGQPLSTYVSELARSVGKNSTAPIVGEKSPAYLTISDDRIALCAALFPELKFICHVRDPVARAWSMIRRLELFETRTDGSADSPVDISTIIRELQRILQYGFYRPHLQRWAAHFPPERFLLLDFDQIGREPAMVFRDVLRHIGADACDPPPLLDGPAAPPPIPAGIRRVLEEVYRGEPWDIASLTSALHQARDGPGASQMHDVKAKVRFAAWRLMLESPGGHPEAHERLASLLVTAGRPDEAIVHLQTLTRLEPDNPAHWRMMAKLFQGAGEIPHATEAWLGLLAVAPEDFQAHANLGRLYTGRGLHAQAAVHFRAEVEARPADAKAWRRLAACLGKTGDAAGELDASTHALRIDGGRA